jgi:hypothetical protein
MDENDKKIRKQYILKYSKMGGLRMRKQVFWLLRKRVFWLLRKRVFWLLRKQVFWLSRCVSG